MPVIVPPPAIQQFGVAVQKLMAKWMGFPKKSLGLMAPPQSTLRRIIEQLLGRNRLAHFAIGDKLVAPTLSRLTCQLHVFVQLHVGMPYMSRPPTVSTLVDSNQ